MPGGGDCVNAETDLAPALDYLRRQKRVVPLSELGQIRLSRRADLLEQRL